MTFSCGHYGYVGDDPAGVESAMTDLGRVATGLGALAGQVEGDTRSIAEHWPAGHTGQVAAGDAARIGGALGECHQAFARAGQDLEVLYEVLVVGRRRVDELNDAHRVLFEPENTFEVRPQVTFGDRGLAADIFAAARARSGFDSVADIDRAYAKVHAHVVEETGLCNELLARSTAAGSTGVSFARPLGVSKFGAAFGLLGGWAGPEVADIIAGMRAFPTEPGAVHAAWVALSPDQRNALLVGAPGRFGNLNGIPAKDRDTANLVTLKRQLGLLRKASDATGIQTPNRPEDLDRISHNFLVSLGDYGLTVPEVRQALLLDRQLHPGDGIKAQLLAYEPGAYGGKGRAAIAYGDVDQADNIAFAVPGLNSGLHNVNNVASDALHLFLQARRADKAKTAVVAWQGYDAPGFADVPFQDHAEAGAKLLAADVKAVRTTHDGAIGGKLTVVGHSYGSTTTGLALQREHLDAYADQVALIGSPGIGGDAKSSADLHLARSQVFVGSASHDLVTTMADSLGADPSADEFGESVIRFKAESVNRGYDINISDHSLYYDSANHSESLYALADIVTGHGDQLGDNGMLAAPRHTEMAGVHYRGVPVPRVVDDEASRTPTSGHDHANDAGGPSS